MTARGIAMERLVSGVKVCTKCATEKPLESFSRNARAGDGRVAWCKDCYLAWARENRDKTRAASRRHSKTERFMATQAGYKESGKRRVWWRADQKKRWADPDKRHKAKVRIFTNLAVELGVLAKTNCIRCGAVAEAHHPDYSKPLDVVWLCQAHHRAAHKEN